MKGLLVIRTLASSYELGANNHRLLEARGS
jgi:hypothetical protein